MLRWAFRRNKMLILHFGKCNGHEVRPAFCFLKHQLSFIFYGYLAGTHGASQWLVDPELNPKVLWVWLVDPGLNPKVLWGNWSLKCMQEVRERVHKKLVKM